MNWCIFVAVACQSQLMLLRSCHLFRTFIKHSYRALDATRMSDEIKTMPRPGGFYKHLAITQLTNSFVPNWVCKRLKVWKISAEGLGGKPPESQRIWALSISSFNLKSVICCWSLHFSLTSFYRFVLGLLSTFV